MSDWVAAWLDIYERWEEDPEPARDAFWVEQLAGVAILHGMPCYEDGVENAGAAGWRRLVGKYRGGRGVWPGGEARGDKRQTASNAPRALPWEAND